MMVACPHCDTRNRLSDDRDPRAGKCGKCGHALFEGKPMTLSGDRFRRHAAESDVPLVVDFWAAWCGPCRAVAPAFEAAAARLEPRARLAKVDTDAESDLSLRYNIRSIPTTVVIKGGKEVGRISGALPAAQLQSWIESNL